MAPKRTLDRKRQTKLAFTPAASPQQPRTKGKGRAETAESTARRPKKKQRLASPVQDSDEEIQAPGMLFSPLLSDQRPRSAIHARIFLVN